MEATTSDINANTTVGQEEDTCFDGTTHAARPGSYAAAKRACIENVQAVARNCIRNNERFTDPDFDLKNDFWNPKGSRNCLNGLFAPVSRENQQSSAQWNEDEFPISEFVDGVHKVDCRSLSAKGIRIRAGAWIMDLKQDPDKQDNEPKSVHRVSEIFERPIFAPGCPEVCIPASTELEQSDETLAKLWMAISQLVSLMAELGLLALFFDLLGPQVSTHLLALLFWTSLVRWT